MDSFDLLVIGGGPAGYVASIKGAQLGLKVACVDKKALGGTCLNVGCIPSKALLESSEHYYQMKHKSGLHGINVTGDITVNLANMMKRKDDVVKQTVDGVTYLINKNKIKHYEGMASFESKDTVRIKTFDGKTTIVVQAKSIIIATGSVPTELPFLPFDEKHILSSTGALSLTTIPKDLILIGGGVIGVEIGSIYARLGTKVTVVEYTDRIIPAFDKDLSKELEKSLVKLGFEYHFNSLVKAGKLQKNKSVRLSVEKNGKLFSLNSEVVLVCVGRKPYIEDLNVSAIGIEVDEKGTIPIDESFRTQASDVYAVGDVVRGPMLAHKASEEAIACVEMIAGGRAVINYNTIPSVVYTWPEVACVGKSEEELKDSGIAYQKGVFPFKASGRARAAGEEEGFVKLLTDKNSDEILGVHMIGPRVSDMIGNSVLAIEYRATGEDLALIPYAHPTYMEAVKEAALLATDGKAIHL